MPQPSSTPPAILEGELQSGAYSAAVVTQFVIGAALVGLAALGAFFIALSFHPTKVPNQWTFGALGAFLIGLCCLGFYFIVIRPWAGGVAWFRVEGDALRYRFVSGGRFVGELSLTSVAGVTNHLFDKPFSDASSWVSIRFQSGESLKVHPYLLSNGEELIELCREACRRREFVPASAYATAIPLDAPHLADLRAELAEDERVFWVGGASTAEYWSELAASFVFGALLASAMLTALTFVAPKMWEDFSFGALFGISVMVGFLALGVALLWAPWRYRRLFAESIYCVTNRRAIVIRGFYWGDGTQATRTSPAMQSFEFELASRYQTDLNGRDIVFDSERLWRSGRRKGWYFLKYGFLCVDDTRGAEAALARLRSQDATQFNAPVRRESV